MKINHSKQAGLAKNPNANDTSFGAFSMACERVELAKLNAHKFLYAQAIHHLSASIGVDLFSLSKVTVGERALA